MKTRVLVAAVGIPVLLLVVLWGPDWVIMGALCALAGIAGVELQRCVSGGTQGDWMVTLLSAAYPVLAVMLYAQWPMHRRLLPVLFFSEVVFVFLHAIHEAGRVKFEQIMAALFSSVGIAWSFSSFLRMESAGLHRVWLLMPFVLSFSCDTFAYLAGRMFGRQKLAPAVSPKKTVEGAVGGLAGNLLCGLLFAFLMNRFLGESVGYGTMAVLSLLCAFAAQAGDLSFSLIKRQYGVKDYGRIFLAHGGVLDRFDSVLFVAPVIEIILSMAGPSAL